MTEILSFVIAGISSCFSAMNHFLLESHGLPSLFDIAMVLIILRIILYIKSYIQSTTEIETTDFNDSKSFSLNHKSPYKKLNRYKYNVPKRGGR